MSLLRQGKAHALTMYVGEADQWHGTPVYVAVVQYLRGQGCAGATVTRAIAGYGAGAQLHTDREWQWPSDAPVIIQVIDQPERLRRCLPPLQEMISGGLMTLHEVEVLKYTHMRAHGIPTHLPVRSIMESAVTTVKPATAIDTIIDLLLDAPFRALPVVDEQRCLQGIISTGDLINADVFPMRRGLLRKALTLDAQVAEAIETPLEQARRLTMTAQDVMNHQVCTVGPETSVREVAKLMVETELRRLPVVSAAGVLLGIVTRADLLQVVVTSPLMSADASTKTQPLFSVPSSGSRKAIGSYRPPTGEVYTPGPGESSGNALGGKVGNGGMPAQQRPIGDYMSPDVTTVYGQTPLQEVIDALVLSPFKRVIVVDGRQRVVGIISDVDVLAQVQAESRPGFLKWLSSWVKGESERLPTGVLRPHAGKAHVAADVMNREVVTVTVQSSVQQTIEYMMTTHRKALPVVDENERLVGIVGRSDVLRVLLES